MSKFISLEEHLMRYYHYASLEETFFGFKNIIKDTEPCNKKYVLVNQDDVEKFACMDTTTKTIYELDGYHFTNKVMSNATFVRWLRPLDL